jgi:DNA replicative helicase MCM subunit Mcm2 (Cdc46/Mcm family)
MIEVFTTNVKEQCEADKLLVLLQQHFSASKINFDLHDCDKILRVEGNIVEVEKVRMLVEENGFVCKVLE